MKKFNWLVIFVLLSVQFLSLSSTGSLQKAYAVTKNTTYNATVSAYVNSANPTENYNSSQYLINSQGNFDGGERVSFFKFDLSDIDEDATVNSADLSMYYYNPTNVSYGKGNATATFYFSQNVSNWGESTINWNNMPNGSSNVNIGQEACPGAAGYQSYDAKYVVSQWVTGTDPNYGFQFIGVPSGGDFIRYFYSTRNANGPKLAINYTDTGAPTISNISVTNISKTSTKINWKTSEKSGTALNWGTSTAYGHSYSHNTWQTTHSYTINSLTAGTTYHFKIKAFDRLLNTKYSTDRTFTTLSNGSSSTDDTQAVDADTATMTVDSSVEPPTLTYVVHDGIRNDAPITDKISIHAGDDLSLTGTAFANAGISIIIGEKAFVGSADDNGDWTIKLDTAPIPDGTYTVKAQAQDGVKNKGSEIINLFDFEVTPIANSSVAAAAQGLSTTWKIILGVIALILIALIILGIVYRKQIAKWFKATPVKPNHPQSVPENNEKK